MGNKHKSQEAKPKKCIKFLMLGISGSGKSTFSKQMQILFKKGFANDELIVYRDIVRLNILVGIKELVKQAEKREKNLLENNIKKARFLMERQDQDLLPWNDSLTNKIMALWKDPAIKQVWSESSSTYQLQIQQLEYLMENMNRIKAENFIPTHEDVLLARQRSAGVSVVEFKAKFKGNKYNFNLIDVGGQMPERQKWQAYLDEFIDIKAVMFFAGLDEYDMISADDRKSTKMNVSRSVFEHVVNLPQMRDISVILFLNKIDLLEKKLKDVKHVKTFRKNFPSYTGKITTDDVSEEIVSKFIALAPVGKPVIVHKICALNTASMEAVFKQIHEDLFYKRMEGLQGF